MTALTPGFRRLLAARVLSVFGDMVLPVAVTFAVLSTLDGGPAAVGFVLGAEFLGMLMFLLLGGVLADRLPPMLTMVGSDMARATIQFTAALLLTTGTMTVPVLAGLLLARGTASAFFSPAARLMLLDLAGPGRIQEASGKLSSAVSVAVVVSPLVGGGLVVWLGPPGAIAVDGLTFVASALLIGSLRRIDTRVHNGVKASAPARSQRSSLTRDLASGAREVLSRPWLWGSIAVAAAFELFASGPWSAVIPVVADQRYGGAFAYSLILSAIGVGAVSGGALAAKLPVRRHVLAASLMLTPIALSSLALVLHADLWIVLITFVVCGACQSVHGTLQHTALSRGVPRAVLGRVNSWDTLGSFAFRPIGQSAGGLVAAHTGPDAILWISTAVILIGPLCLVANPWARVQTADLEKSVSAPAEPNRADNERAATPGVSQ